MHPQGPLDTSDGIGNEPATNREKPSAESLYQEMIRQKKRRDRRSHRLERKRRHQRRFRNYT